MPTAPRTEERGAAPWLWVLILAAIFTQSGLNLLRPVTSYKLLAFGADSVAVGIATAAYAVIPLAVAIALGRLSDRLVKLRVLLAVGAATFGLGGVGLALAPEMWGVILASAVLGFGHLAFTIAGQSAIARYSKPGTLDTGFGWFTAAYSVGQLIGPFLGGLIVDGSSGEQRLGAVETALWVGAAIAAAGTLLFIAPLPGSPQDQRALQAKGGHAPSGKEIQDQRDAKPTVLRIMKQPGVPTAMLAALSLLAMLDILTAFLPVVGEHLGISPGIIGGLLALRALASILCRAGLPWMIGRLGRRPLMLWCLYGSAVALAAPPLFLQFFPGLLGILLAAALLVVGGFFLGIGQPLTMTAISQSVPAAWRGSALAVRLMGNRLGQVLMPLVAGVVAAPWGPAGAIWMSCALLGVSGVASSLEHRRGE